MPSSRRVEQRCGPEGLIAQCRREGSGLRRLSCASTKARSASRHPACRPMMRCNVRRHAWRQKRLDIESGDIADRDREHHADADLGIGSEDDIQRFLVLRHQRIHVLDGGDAVPQAFHRTEQRARPQLGFASLAPIGRLRMQRPDIERHVFEAAFQRTS